MSQIINLQLLRAAREATSKKALQKKIEQITRALVFENVVIVNGIQYTMEDAIREQFHDPESRDELQEHLLAQLHATGEDIEPSVSRVNRLLIKGARELAVKLASGQQQIGGTVHG